MPESLEDESGSLSLGIPERDVPPAPAPLAPLAPAVRSRAVATGDVAWHAVLLGRTKGASDVGDAADELVRARAAPDASVADAGAAYRERAMLRGGASAAGAEGGGGPDIASAAAGTAMRRPSEALREREPLLLSPPAVTE